MAAPARSRPITNHEPAPDAARRVSQSANSVCGSHTSAVKPAWATVSGSTPTIRDGWPSISTVVPRTASDPPKRALPEAMADEREPLAFLGVAIGEEAAALGDARRAGRTGSARRVPR